MALLTEREGQPVGTSGDYAIFCLYKTLPLPDGAVLVQNRGKFDQLTALPLRRSGRVFTAGRIAELGLERIRSRWPNMGRHLMDWKLAAGRLLTRLRVERVPVGDTGFDVANESLQVMGGLGYTQETLVEYCVRRTRGWMIAGGSIEMMKNRLAEIIFGRRFSQRAPRAEKRE